MTNTVFLAGAEDVRRAGSEMQSAASDIRYSAGSFDNTIHEFKRFMNEWLDRFEQIIGDMKNEASRIQ